MTSKWRRCDVVTSHRRHFDVICLLGIWPPLAPQYSKPWPPQYSKPSYAYGTFFHMVTHATCHTLSNAFLKSMKTWYRFWWYWRYFSHRILRLKICSVVLIMQPVLWRLCLNICLRWEKRQENELDATRSNSHKHFVNNHYELCINTRWSTKDMTGWNMNFADKCILYIKYKYLFILIDFITFDLSTEKVHWTWVLKREVLSGRPKR